MELTRQQKVGLAVAAVAIAALVVDRMTGGGSPLGPASAQAAAAPAASDPAAGTKPEATPAPGTPGTGSMRARLDAARSKEHIEVSDGFAPPKNWMTHAQAEVPIGREPSIEERAAALVAAHRLTGVSMGARQVVVIDGTAYTLGASRNGLTLVSIAQDGRSVVVESEGVEATLVLSSTDK